MRVALGTIEIDDETRKKIRKATGGKGHATRGEVKDFLLGKIDSDVIPQIGNEEPPASEDSDTDERPATIYHPETAPGEGELPEPSHSAGTAGVTGAPPATGPGNLGSDGTPGGGSTY